MKKILCALLSVVMCFAMFAGCSKKLKSKNPEETVDLSEFDFTAGSDYTDTIKVWVTSADSEKQIINSFVSAFNEIYPNITVKVECLNSLSDQLVYNAGLPSMCDVFWVSPEMIAQYREYGIIMPLSDVIAADKSVSLDDLVASSVESCTDDDKLYIMPRDYNQVVMYYNLDMFDAAGVDYPSNGEAMSESDFVQMLASLKAGLTASDEKNSYNIPYSEAFSNSLDASILWDSLAWPIIKSYGGRIFDENGNYLDENGKMLFESDETVNAMKFVNMLTTNGYMGSPTNWSTRDSVQFLMEQAPVYLHTRAVLSNIITANSTYHGIKRLGVAPCPNFGKQDNYFVGSGATGYSLYSGSSHKTAAWLFLKFIIGERAQEEASKSGNITPVLESLLADPTAQWRVYGADKFDENFDYGAFVYRRDECYTHVRDFFKYIGVSYQKVVFERMQNCYTDAIDNIAPQSESDIRTVLKKYGADMKNYIIAGAK